MAEVVDMKFNKCCCLCNCFDKRRLSKLAFGGLESGLIAKFIDYHVLNAYLCGNCKRTLHSLFSKCSILKNKCVKTIKSVFGELLTTSLLHHCLRHVRNCVRRAALQALLRFDDSNYFVHEVVRKDRFLRRLHALHQISVNLLPISVQYRQLIACQRDEKLCLERV